MTTPEILLAAGIHLVVPIGGILYFGYLRRQMILSGVSNPPVIELFLVFAIYGTLLILLLTCLFWKWSAMASLGAIFAVFIAPILMAFIFVRLKLDKPPTKYHLVLQKAALYYFLILPVCLFLLFTFANK